MVFDKGTYDILTLAPHQRSPIINFGYVKADSENQKVLIIKNPQNFQVKLNVTCQGHSMNQNNYNKMTLIIEKNSSIDFKIKWQPVESGNYKYKILFEVIEPKSLRKIIVNCYGDCSTSTFKKPASVRRTPLGQLQFNGQKSLPTACSTNNNNKLTNPLLFVVDPTHTCEYHEMKKASSLPNYLNNNENNIENDEPIKRKFLIETIYNSPNHKRTFRPNVIYS